jgi:photosystem II stability/assembly factor-like uncharacterized protein
MSRGLLPPRSAISLIRPTPGTAFLLLQESRPRSRSAPHRRPPGVAYTLSYSADAGRRWTHRPLPCAPENATVYGGGPNILAAEGPRTVLLSCQTPGSGTPSVLYRSTDQGRSWVRLTPHFASYSQATAKSIGYDNTSLDPVGPTVIWAVAVTNQQMGTGTIYRSTNGGRTWRSVLHADPRHSDKMITIDALTATSPTTAWVTTGNPGLSPSILHTTNGGTTWSTVRLPTPSGPSRI